MQTHRRDGDDLRAVDHLARVLAEHGELRHRGLERLRHELLLVDEALPEARRARVVREAEVGLEAELADVRAVPDGEGRGDFARVVVAPGEADALEQSLKEELGVEGEGSLSVRDQLNHFETKKHLVH